MTENRKKFELVLYHNWSSQQLRCIPLGKTLLDSVSTMSLIEDIIKHADLTFK